MRGRAPISAHPAFPLLVALWFAALLGLGTVVMPGLVLEQLASATGLSSVFPQAEAPITASARAAFALLATIVGAAGGLALARRVATSQQYATRSPRRRAPRGADHAAERAVRPLSVHDDLGEGIAAPAADQRTPVPGPIPGRRRALAVLEEERPSDFLLAAPLPGHEDTAAPDLPTDEEPMTERPSEFDAPQPVETEEELDLSQLVADSPIYDPPVDQPPADAQVFAAPLEQVEKVAVEEEAVVPAYVPELDTRKPRDLVAPAAPEAADEPTYEADPVAAPLAAAPVTDAPLDATLEDLGMVQLAERLGRSLQQRLAAATLSPETEIEPATEPLTFSAPSLEQEPDVADEAVIVPPPVVPDALRAFMDEAPEEAAPTETDENEIGELQVPVPVVPSALRPFAFEPFGNDDDDEDDHDAASFTLPLATMMPRAFDAPTVSASMDFAPDEADEADEDALAETDESYPSLLEMNNPFRQREEFVRVDEPDAEDEEIEPAVVFPGQQEPAVGEAAAPANPARPFDAPHQAAPSTAPVRPRAAADPAETDRALRSALANLQRMSGAA